MYDHVLYLLLLQLLHLLGDVTGCNHVFSLLDTYIGDLRVQKCRHKTNIKMSNGYSQKDPQAAIFTLLPHRPY